jgi:hypothetical protein
MIPPVDFAGEVRSAVDEFASGEIPGGQLRAQVAEMAQARASTQAVLYDTEKTEEWKATARFEYECVYEVELWEPHLERLREVDQQFADVLQLHLKNLRAMAAEFTRRTRAAEHAPGGAPPSP